MMITFLPSLVAGSFLAAMFDPPAGKKQRRVVYQNYIDLATVDIVKLP
ncbi:MAG TPA: hypothetical protein PL061_10750 [Syntrophales bacterium]|jgi:hypothetical protein|nr:hypothetical protein [Syntrophales bacterium]